VEAGRAYPAITACLAAGLIKTIVSKLSAGANVDLIKRIGVAVTFAVSSSCSGAESAAGEDPTFQSIRAV
jgi:hypothetical protein